MPESKPQAPSLTIGMPVYNGERFIARALASLISQDFRDWVLIVADNCSTDGTCAVVEAFCRKDARIRLVRHEKNLGAVGNFLYLAEQADTPFFMWAAHDDEWSSNYISACLAQLNTHPDVGFASGRVVNTDAEGRHVRVYEPFAPFGVAGRSQRLSNFVRAREADGKANMIYSVFRTPLVQTICDIPHILEGWGADMVFVAAALARAQYRQTTQATLLKRIVNDAARADTSSEDYYSRIAFRGHYPLPLHDSYVQALCRSMPDQATSALVRWTMRRRRLLLSLRQRLAKVSSAASYALERLGTSLRN